MNGATTPDLAMVALTTAGSVLVAIAAPFFGWLGVRDAKRRRLAKAEATPEPTSAAVKTAVSFAEGVAIHEIIMAAVEDAVAPIRLELADVKGKLEDLQNRETRILTIIRRYFQRLLLWDVRGRHGELPTPSEAEMRELDLEDLRLGS